MSPINLAAREITDVVLIGANAHRDPCGKDGEDYSRGSEEACSSGDSAEQVRHSTRQPRGVSVGSLPFVARCGYDAVLARLRLTRARTASGCRRSMKRATAMCPSDFAWFYRPRKGRYRRRIFFVGPASLNFSRRFIVAAV